MKSRLNLIFCALVVVLITMVWVVRDRGTTDVAIAPAMTSSPAELSVVPALPASSATAVVPPSAASTPSVYPPAAAIPGIVATTASLTTPEAVEISRTPAIPDVELKPRQARPLVHVEPDGSANYTARAGDTVSELAIALLGSDSKDNRAAVIAANASLQTNADRVLVGQKYNIVPPAAASSTPATAVAAGNTPVTAATGDKADSTRSMTYTAQPGDNVAILAGNLLGGDTKTNRDAIIGDNASLQRDPNHLVAGKTYNITTTAGLAADPAAPQVAQPTTQPDADEAAVLSVGRVLRYTAQPGDSVSKLATVLLGSDTKANRDIIITNNRSLKQDPDHLEAGKTYSIPAPTAAPVADTSAP